MIALVAFLSGRDVVGSGGSSCYSEPEQLVGAFYARIDAMASSGYLDDHVDAVEELIEGQAAEVVAADVAYFAGTDIRQVGRTAVATIEASDASAGTIAARYRANIVLDVSGVSYVRDGAADVVTNRTSDMVPVQLTLSDAGGCLAVSRIDFP